MKYIWPLVFFVAVYPHHAGAQTGNFTYQHVFGTGDTLSDPNSSGVLQAAACDAGALLRFEFSRPELSVYGEFRKSEDSTFQIRNSKSDWGAGASDLRFGISNLESPGIVRFEIPPAPGLSV